MFYKIYQHIIACIGGVGMASCHSLNRIYLWSFDWMLIAWLAFVSMIAFWKAKDETQKAKILFLAGFAGRKFYFITTFPFSLLRSYCWLRGHDWKRSDKGQHCNRCYYYP